MLESLLPYRWRTRLAATRHDRVARAVLDTPPIRGADDGLVLFSMMGTRVLLPYLVAVKSLWGQLGRGRVAILDDGTLTLDDKALLAYHCGNPEIIPIASVDTTGFPQGGTWERLLTILDRRAGEYWVQLDSDTVTIGPVAEVAAAIEANRSFAFLGGTDAEIGALPLGEIASRLYPDGPEDGHVQARFESRLGQVDPVAGWRYIRGCSGFAGFAAGGEGRARARQFLALLKGIVGPEDVTIWGTEQIASNFHLANEPDAALLPSARYVNYWGEDWADDTAFLHFVGPFRHYGDAYARTTAAAIAAMGVDQGPPRNTARHIRPEPLAASARAAGDSPGTGV